MLPRPSAILFGILAAPGVVGFIIGLYRWNPNNLTLYSDLFQTHSTGLEQTSAAPDPSKSAGTCDGVESSITLSDESTQTDARLSIKETRAWCNHFEETGQGAPWSSGETRELYGYKIKNVSKTPLCIRIQMARHRDEHLKIRIGGKAHRWSRRSSYHLERHSVSRKSYVKTVALAELAPLKLGPGAEIQLEVLTTSPGYLEGFEIPTPFDVPENCAEGRIHYLWRSTLGGYQNLYALWRGYT